MTTKQKKLRDLAEKYTVGGPPVGDEFTTTEWADATGHSRPHAHAVLKSMVKRGEVAIRRGRVNGKVGNIYKPV